MLRRTERECIEHNKYSPSKTIEASSRGEKKLQIVLNILFHTILTQFTYHVNNHMSCQQYIFKFVLSFKL